MDWIKNLKISHKLLVLIVTALSFLLVIGLVGYHFTHKASLGIASLYKDRLLPIKELGGISSNSNAINADLLAILLSDTMQKKINYNASIKSLADENTELLNAYESSNLTNEDKDLLTQLKEKRVNYAQSRNKVIKLAFAGKSDAGLAVYRSETKKAYKEYSQILNEIVENNSKSAQLIHEQDEKDSVISNTILVITIIISFTLLILLGLMISKMITDPITIAVEDLEEGATMVASASTQLSAASQKLAEGSTEQAAAIQETSASIEESDSMIKQNADNTKEAALLAKKTKEFADRSTQGVAKMMTSILELKESSDEIAKIIKIIDEIAFQTNILALNAAVEAARAGDAGKGFAVVAEEVRNLAQKSAEATRDTAQIIERNVNLSKQSVEATKLINDDMKEIDMQAQKVSDLLNEISVASQEQATGIEQIDKAILQMEQVLQSNASAAEESASASCELSSQACNVKEIVNKLYVMVEGQDALKEKDHAYN